MCCYHSSLNNRQPEATFKEDIDAARDAILAETTQGRDVIVIAHSYGGMVGNSAIKGLTAPSQHETSTTPTGTGKGLDDNYSASAGTLSLHTKTSRSPANDRQGYVKALTLIASGFTITGLSFMDPFLGLPLP